MFVLTFGGYYLYLNTNWAASWARDYTATVATVLADSHGTATALDIELSEDFIEDNIEGFDIDLDDQYYLPVTLTEDEFMAIVTLDGEVIASNYAFEDTILETITFPLEATRDLAFNENEYHAGLAGIWNANDELIGWLYFEGNGDDIAFALGQTARQLTIPTILSGLLAIFVSAIMGAILASYFGNRLRKLSTVSTAFAAGDLQRRVQLQGKDEFAQLGTQFNQMADQLQTQMDELHDLATLEERNRLARELHDGVKQQLFSLNLTVGAIKSIVRSNPDVAEERLNQVVLQSQQIHQELDAIIKQLRPLALEDHGLAHALERLTQTWQASHNATVTYQAVAAREVARDIEEALYRVTQEALQNIGKHANAQSVDLQLTYSDADLQLTIADNGIGFDQSSQRDSGLGMRSMQERMSNVGGTLTVSSVPGRGTTLKASVPIGIEI